MSAPLMVIWGVFDWILAPEHFTLFLWLRIAAASLAILLAYGIVLRTTNPKVIVAAWWLWCAIWNFAIAVMLMYVSQDPLPFVVGACLCLLGPGLLPVWRAKHTLTNEAAQSIALVSGLMLGGASTENLLTGAITFGSISAVVTVVTVFRLRVREELFETQSQLEQANLQLQQLDTTRRRLFHNVSHELRTPLTLIISPVDEMLSRMPAGPGRESMRLIRRNAARLLRMIDDLLDLAKLEAGGLRLRVQQTDVAMLARQVSENARPACEVKGIELLFRERGEPPVMYGDPHRLEIVFTNLVGNAVKFTPAGGRITVEVVHSPRGATVSVSDTGPGIPEDELGKVFQRFHQVQSSERREHGGAGIGLSLAKELTEVHGGDLSVESIWGHGATFHAFLPAGDEHFGEDVIERRQLQLSGHPGRRMDDRLASAPPAVDTAGRHGRQAGRPEERIVLDRGRRPRVLVVEDEADLRGFMQDVLGRSYDVTVAENGAKALETLAAERPDLILTDIMMPEVSGIDLCRAIKSDPSLQHIPVILLTAHGDSDTAIEGYGAGADDFVAKPFHVKVLLARVRAHLKMRRLSLQIADQARLASAGTLAAGLAHEVKNPLNAAVNAVRILEEGGSSKVPREKLMGLVIDALARIDGIISALDSHARPADGTDLQAVDVQEGIESTLRLLEHRTGSIRIHRTLEAADRVRAPARAFNQVVLNLLDNAIRAANGNIWVTLRQREDWVVVSVEDDGPGVAPDIAHHIFDAFFTTRPEGEGTGLGLNLSRRLARECGGELRYEARAGGGAKFVLEVPVLETAEAATDAAQ